MSIQKVLEMAEKFVTLAEEGKGTVVFQQPRNEYQVQREKLSNFFDSFHTQLRRIVAEMGNDLSTLKYRGFDAKMFKMFASVYDTLISLSKEIKEDKPYIAADKLVHYVFDRPTRIVLENLDYIAKSHVESTNVDFKESKMFRHPQIRSLDQLKQLALALKEYMEKNPLIEVPGTTSPLVPRMVEKRENIPEFRAGQEDKTNPAIPGAKRP